MKALGIYLLLMLLCSGAAAQNYGFHMIADELTKGANAVVREETTRYDYKNKTSATETYTIVVTVLNRNGDGAARAGVYTNKNRSLKSFSGEIYDANGKSLRKIKRSDLQSSEYSDGLADDTKMYFYTAHVPTYPYTVKYTWEVTWKDGIVFFPSFAPLPGENISVEKATYTLTLPEGTAIHTKTVNTDIEPRKEIKGGNDVYEWSVENIRPIVTEPYGRSVRELLPMVYLTPHEFSYNGIEGVMDGWENYARWQWKLMDGRQELPAALKDEIARLTAEAQTDIEKIRALYDYLAATTRYVSIQIGIGGLQPMTAEQVYTRKFGDCKALSNYMRSMLAHCGIPSYYVEIGVNGKDIIPDYANPVLSNHAILAVPQQNGQTLWLECTAPELPLGFVHSGIAGQNALVYKEGGAHIEKVPVYADSLNLSKIDGVIEVAADGSTNGSVVKTDAYNRYDDLFRFGKMDAKERVNYLQRDINLPLAEISDVSFEEQKTATPYALTSFAVSTKPRTGEASGRLFLTVSPFRKLPLDRMGRSKRRTDIVVADGLRDADRIRVELADNYQIEALPQPQIIENKYGIFRQTVLPDRDAEGRIIIDRLFQINSGEYPPEEAEEFKKFIDAVSSGYAAEIVINRK